MDSQPESYRVEALAAAAGVGVDTIRFYQARGLLAPPRRQGRCALYDAQHLERLRRVRDLQQQGFSLAQIGHLIERPDAAAEAPLLRALVEEGGGEERRLSRAELAAEAGVPEALVRAVEASGIAEPLGIGDEATFGEADLQMARSAMKILEGGFPLATLIQLALGHAQHVNETCEAAIDLFDEHVRKQGPTAGDPDAITDAFRLLLPQVTRLVALHFQRTLINRALERLSGSEDADALAAARAATESARLEVAVDWR
ncbi:MAG: MerR family transcriptional regulator [Myxococcales bacterium]|nr:MerR family transcriptional regulator [Myxococcales bacterium]